MQGYETIGVLGYPRVSWSVLGYLGVIRLTVPKPNHSMFDAGLP